MLGRTSALILVGLSLHQIPASAEPPAARLKELVSLEGVRDNQLIGYGIVVGLKGTGDRQQTLFTAQSLANMLQQMGVTVNSSTMLVRNTAAAMVTATLPPFAQPGMQIDVTVAAMGDCASLQGGLLLMTSLRGINGQVYSVAQGPVVTGGFILGGAGSLREGTQRHPGARAKGEAAHHHQRAHGPARRLGRVPVRGQVERDSRSGEIGRASCRERGGILG